MPLYVSGVSSAFHTPDFPSSYISFFLVNNFSPNRAHTAECFLLLSAVVSRVKQSTHFSSVTVDFAVTYYTQTHIILTWTHSKIRSRYRKGEHSDTFPETQRKFEGYLTNFLKTYDPALCCSQ